MMRELRDDIRNSGASSIFLVGDFNEDIYSNSITEFIVETKVA